MSNYLDQIVEATKAHNTNVKSSRSNMDQMLRLLQERTGAASPAPQGNRPSGGVHSMGDGHGHSSTAEVKGLNAEFNSALQRLIKDSGGKVKIGSGYRSIAEQQVLYDRWKRGVPGQAQAAPPGKSNHNHGLAADLTYADDNSRKWVHANAANYGLRFPMSYEPWHIEPVNAREIRNNPRR